MRDGGRVESSVGPEFEENLSLRYLASALARAGFHSEILPFNQGSQLPGLVARIARAEDPPVLVGISMAFQWRAPDMLALAVALREAGYTGHITFGGHFATFASREVLRDFPEVDSICRQEAEETLVELVQRVAAGLAYADVLGLAVRDAEGAPRINSLRSAPELSSCFNVLLFDPDTTLESLEDNLAFMEAHAHHPFNFGRTELYAGTPLLHRMQQEGRARGDWLQWGWPMPS